MRPLGATLLFLLGSGAAAQTCDNTYEVRAGDTLSLIAGAVYGDILAWERLHQANLDTIGPDPARIEIGMQLFIECDEPVTAESEEIKDEVEALQYVSVTPTDIPWNIQPDPTELAGLLAVHGTQVIDIRSTKAQAGGVIPGALSMPFTEWRGPKANPGQPADNAKLSALIGGAGLRLDQPIVIVHAKGDAFDTGRGAYVYWLLKSAGAQQIALLDGGHKAWVEAGLPLADIPALQRPYEVQIELADTWMATTDDVQQIINGEADGILIDARPESIWNKHDKSGLPVASTLSGASNIPVPVSHSLMRDTNNDPLSLLLRLKDQGVNWQNEPVIHFCNTGELAALNWFHASEVSGITNVKLYPDSSHGWKAKGGELTVAEPGE